MAVAGIQQTLLSYTMEKAAVTNQLTTIMFRLTEASKDGLETMEQTNRSRQALAQAVANGSMSSDSTEYNVASQKIEEDYQLQLAEINSWESELEQQKNNLETEIKEISSFEESWTAAIKQNIKKDFSYASSGSSS